MFFYLSKIIWMMIAPTNITVFLLLGGFLLLVLQKIKIGFYVLGLGICGVIAFGVLPTGHNLTAYLENKATATAADAQSMGNANGIILLGGMFNNRLSRDLGRPEAGYTIDRVHAFQELSAIYPHARLYYTGGKGDVMQNDRNEADIIRDYFRRISFVRQVIYEDESRNTYENAKFLAKLLQRDNNEYILITSAFHMPRAKAVFEKAGYNIAAYPADYQTNGKYKILPVTTSFASNFSLSDLAVKEIVGHLAYKLTGKL